MIPDTLQSPSQLQHLSRLVFLKCPRWNASSDEVLTEQ